MSKYGDDYGVPVDDIFYDPRYVLNPNDDVNNPVGNTSNNYLFPVTGGTNYFDVDPPSTGIGGPGTSYTQNPDGTVTVNPDTGGGGGGSASEPNSGITDFINRILGTNKSGADLAKLAAVLGGGLAGGFGAFAPKTQKVGYQGGIPKYDAVRNMATAPNPNRRPGAGGNRYGGDVSFMPKGSAPVGGGLSSLIGRGLTGGSPATDTNDSSVALRDMMKAINTPRTPREYDYPEPIRGNEMRLRNPAGPILNDESYAKPYAQGGLMGLAKGRYLQGQTDGMADEIPARIGKDQPAALSHGEFVIPADVVSHLGNGNSDAGAKKLYSMMDKIRQARTGTKKQGKKINPDSFMPGGLAQAYANGGTVQHFQAGGAAATAAAAGVTGTEQAPSSWAGEYITNMLGKGQALAEAPYQEYGGPLTAGASNLQKQAFGNAANLSVPGSVGTAAQTAGDIASKAQGMTYTPTQFTNQFNAPAAYTPSGAPQYNQLSAGNVSSTFQAPAPYQAATFGNQFQAPTQTAATNFTNQFKAPDQYQNTAFKSGTFGGEQAQQYMNPYLQQSLSPQLAEARRQADITEQANRAAMTKAGAFGGGRQAILAAEGQRNLGTNLANITGKGYDTAFQNAMSQYNADQARNMQAQQASEQSKQFGAGQSMTAAQMMAQYGMSAQQAQEAARQFNQQQAMTGAQSAAQYGLAGQQAGEASRQFGANLGLQGATTAGAQNLQAALANQQAGLTAGQGNINAAMEAARQQEQSRQFGAGQGMTAAQQAAQYGQAAQTAAEQSRQFGAQQGMAGLNTALQAAQTQGNLGISSADLGLRQLQQQLAAGQQERGIESEGIAADKAAFEEARANPYKMLQFQQSLLQGLPITATNYEVAQPNFLTNAAGGATTVDKLLDTLGLKKP